RAWGCSTEGSTTATRPVPPSGPCPRPCASSGRSYGRSTVSAKKPAAHPPAEPRTALVRERKPILLAGDLSLRSTRENDINGGTVVLFIKQILTEYSCMRFSAAAQGVALALVLAACGTRPIA